MEKFHIKISFLLLLLVIVFIVVGIEDISAENRVEDDHEEAKWNDEEDEAQHWISTPHIADHTSRLKYCSIETNREAIAAENRRCVVGDGVEENFNGLKKSRKFEL